MTLRYQIKTRHREIYTSPTWSRITGSESGRRRVKCWSRWITLESYETEAEARIAADARRRTGLDDVGVFYCGRRQ